MNNFTRLLETINESCQGPSQLPLNSEGKLELYNPDFYRRHGLDQHAELITKAKEYQGKKKNLEQRKQAHNELVLLYRNVGKAGGDHHALAKAVLHYAGHTDIHDNPSTMTNQHLEDLKKDPSKYGMDHRVAITHARFK